MNTLVEVLSSMLEDPTVEALYGAEIREAMDEWKDLIAKSTQFHTVSHETMELAREKGVRLFIRVPAGDVCDENVKAVCDGRVVYVSTMRGARGHLERHGIKINSEHRVSSIWPEGER